jgi:hypothetical protein
MIEYRVYRLDGVSRETRTELIEAQTDAEAVNRIQLDMGTTVRCEIWRGNRVVKRLEASKPPQRP